MSSNRVWWFLPAVAFSAAMGSSLAFGQTAPGSTGAHKGQEITPAQYVTDCIDHYEKHDLTAALANCNDAVRLAPQWATAFYDRGVVRYALEDFAGALKDYNEADSLSPDEAKILFARGVVHYRLGNKGEAMTDYDRAIHLRIKDPTAYLNRAVLRTDNGDWAGAESDFKRAIKKRPDFANAYVNRAAERRKAGDVEGATADYTKALELDPTDASSFYNRGTLRFEHHDIDGAIQDYSSAIRLDGKDARVYYDRGVAYQLKKELAPAVDDYLVVLGLKPEDRRTLYNLGQCEFDLHDYQKAANYYTDALRAEPNWADALHGRGLAYVKLGKFDDAIRDYTAALASQNGYGGAVGQAGIFFDRAVAYQRKYDADQSSRESLTSAIQDYNSAIEKGLKTPDVYYDLGFAYQKTNQTPESIATAIANYDLALAARPDYGEALRQRGEEYDAQGYWQKAIQDLEKAQTERPTDSNVCNALARAYYGNHEYEKAIQTYTKEIDLRASGEYGQEVERKATAEAYISRGTARYQSKDSTGAVDDYNKAIALKNDSVLAYCNLNAAYLRSGQYGKAEESRASAMKVAPEDAKTFCKGDVLSEEDVAALKEFEQGHVSQAVAGYREAVRVNPNDASAHYGLGVALYSSEPKDLAGAIAEFNAALNLRHDFAEAYNGRGLAYRAQGNLGEAEKDLRKAISQRADYSAALSNLAQVRAAQKEWADALTYYQKSLAIKNENEVAWEGSGLAHYKLGDWNASEADYTKAINLKDASVEAFLGRGDAFARQGKWTEAKADYEKALENHNAASNLQAKNGPPLAAILLDRGVARYQLGDRNGAREDYDKAIHLDRKGEPGYYDRAYLSLMEHRLGTALTDSNQAVRLSRQENADALDVDGIARANEKQLKRSLEDFNKALDLKPGDIDLLFNRAAVRVVAHDYSGAISDYTEILSKRPQDADAYYGRGIANGAKGDFQAALSDYSNAIHIRPNFEAAYANRWDLYRAMGEEENAKADFETAKKLRNSDAKTVTPRY
jgi:tetratricopeptide (TPR) repeat protein